jgi:hypothetical protein
MKPMRNLSAFVCALGVLYASAAANADAAKPVQPRGPATIKELMTLVVEPTSNGIFNVGNQPPKTDADWKTLQSQALTLLELANSLTSANRAKDKAQWLTYVKALQGASKTAFAAAMAKNVEALTDLSDPLYMTCADCHEHYLPKK